MKVELFEPPTGSDLTVVNAARVSFGKRSDWEYDIVGWEENRLGDKDPIMGNPHLSKADAKLIKFLARGLTTEDWDKFLLQLEDAAAYADHTGDYQQFTELLWQFRRTPEHFAPFAHPHVTFHIKAPIFVARQLGKHQVGMVWSEVSRRYVDSKPEFYVPEVWRKRADNVKQGSSDETVDRPYMNGHMRGIHNQALLVYNEMLERGVCPEQARMVLPQSMMTEWVWTGSLYGWANIYNKRKEGSHAQRECWTIADQIAEHMKKYLPVSWEALTNVPA